MFEGEFLLSIRGQLLWRRLPFAGPQDDVPRFSDPGDIEWAEFVMPMTPSATEVMYMKALKKLPP